MAKTEMTPNELIEEFDQFINDNGLYSQFLHHIEKKGYTEAEYEELMEQAKG